MRSFLVSQKKAQLDAAESALQELYSQRDSLDNAVRTAEQGVEILKSELAHLEAFSAMPSMNMEQIQSQIFAAQGHTLNFWANAVKSMMPLTAKN